MVVMEKDNTEQFQTPGSRLEHLLAQIGFEKIEGKSLISITIWFKQAQSILETFPMALSVVGFPRMRHR